MGEVADEFARRYRGEFSTYQRAAERARQAITETLSGRGFSLHLVSARAKDPDSVEQKIREKGYGRPKQQMTDLLGVRVITTYKHDVDKVVQRLWSSYEIDERNSIDKTSALSVEQFGYRGVHVVLTVGKTGELAPVGPVLERVKVEVQVRSIVEHAWAEIEHELRYKSGIDFEDDLARRFNAISGTLEIVDREFSAIEAALIDQIHARAESYRRRVNAEDLDTVGLLALLEVKRPQAVKQGPHDLALPLRVAGVLVRTLRSVGVHSVKDLSECLNQADVRAVVRAYVESMGDLDAEEASARVLIGAVVGLRDPKLLASVNLHADSSLVAAIETRLAARNAKGKRSKAPASSK